MKNKIYFTLDMDGSPEHFGAVWDSGEEDYFQIMVSLDKDDWEGSEPKWEDIESDVLKSGLVTDGFGMECTLILNRFDQSNQIQKMNWEDLRGFIIDSLSNQGWSFIV